MLKAFGKIHSKKRTKILESLTTSMIPIVCSDVLWQLPSSHDAARGTSANDQLKQSQAVSLFTDSNQQLLITSDDVLKDAQAINNKSMNPSNASTGAIRGNGILIS